MASQSETMYAEATATLRNCDHPDRGCEIAMGKGETLWVCVECWNKHVAQRRAARKQQLAEHNAAQPQCDRCGRQPVRWHYGEWGLCGRCKTAVEREHHRNLARTGNAAFAAMVAGGRLAVNTTGWAVNEGGTQ